MIVANCKQLWINDHDHSINHIMVGHVLPNIYGNHMQSYSIRVCLKIGFPIYSTPVPPQIAIKGTTMTNHTRFSSIVIHEGVSFSDNGEVYGFRKPHCHMGCLKIRYPKPNEFSSFSLLKWPFMGIPPFQTHPDTFFIDCLRIDHNCLMVQARGFTMFHG